MKRIIYIFILGLFASVLTLQAQEEIYYGLVSVKQNVAELKENNLYLDMDISLCNLTVGRYQSLRLTPMLTNGQDSVRMQPILINGANRQKMYKRACAFEGKLAAEGDAYRVVKNDPTLIRVLKYKKTLAYRPWMTNLKLILIGELINYDGLPVQLFRNVLTEDLAPIHK
ncbi:MAG: DUF3868 domain-containing protein [Tannerellaceae bacterium]